MLRDALRETLTALEGSNNASKAGDSKSRRRSRKRSSWGSTCSSTDGDQSPLTAGKQEQLQALCDAATSPASQYVLSPLNVDAAAAKAGVFKYRRLSRNPESTGCGMEEAGSVRDAERVDCSEDAAGDKVSSAAKGSSPLRGASPTRHSPMGRSPLAVAVSRINACSQPRDVQDLLEDPNATVEDFKEAILLQQQGRLSVNPDLSDYGTGATAGAGRRSYPEIDNVENFPYPMPVEIEDGGKGDKSGKGGKGGKKHRGVISRFLCGVKKH